MLSASQWCVTLQIVALLLAARPAVLRGQELPFLLDDLEAEELRLIQVGVDLIRPAVDLSDTTDPRHGMGRTLIRATVDNRGFSHPDSALLYQGDASREHVPPILQKIKADTANTTAAEILAVKTNDHGDLQSFLSSVAFDTSMVVLFLFVFTVLRVEFPMVYEHNGIPKCQEVTHHLWSMWGWISAAIHGVVEAEDDLSLDAIMAVHFHALAMKLAAIVGIPMCIVMCPLHYWLGGMPPEKVDPLSRIGIANTLPGSWLYWVHAVVLLLVTVVVEHLIFEAMDHFLERRIHWRRSMPEPRSSTVMIQNIPSGPEGFCSDRSLRAYIQQHFPEWDLTDVHVVRRTEGLLAEKAKLEAAQLLWRQAEAARRAGKHHVRRGCCGVVRASRVEHYRQEAVEAFQRMLDERNRLLHAGDKDDWAYTTTAFVTFASQRHAEMALRMQFTAHADEFVTSVPPDPNDIRWADLKGDLAREAVLQRVGYLCVIGLYIGFMPITVTISSITNLEHLRETLPFVDEILARMPWLETGLEGILASLALTLFLSLLPSLLMFVFDNFFVLTANAWAQHKLQNWYFWFQVIFVLLVTVVGGSIVIAFKQIVQQPFAVFGLLADSMPEATHFYLNFIVLQSVTHASNLLRYFNLMTYLALLPVVGEKRAKELSEPSDQAYYGFGSRSARWTLNVAIMIVFCQISPLISLVGLLDFTLCRLVYGYLLVFAEPPTPDLGGVFFVQQLMHIQTCMFIYVALMIGVLLRRGPNYGPVLLGVFALAFLAYRLRSFHIRYQSWRTLPFDQVMDAERHLKRAAGHASYLQPELDPEVTEEALEAQHF